MSKAAPVSEVELSSISREETFAWLSTAILTNLDWKVSLTSHSEDLLKLIVEDESIRDEFFEVVKGLAEMNEFGLTELSHSDADRVLRFVVAKVSTSHALLQNATAVLNEERKSFVRSNSG